MIEDHILLGLFILGPAIDYLTGSFLRPIASIPDRLTRSTACRTWLTTSAAKAMRVDDDLLMRKRNRKIVSSSQIHLHAYLR